MFRKSFDFFYRFTFFPKTCNFSTSRDRTHAGCQKERVPEEAEIGVFPKSIDFFTDSCFFQKHVTFLLPRDIPHAVCPKEKFPEEAEISVFLMIF